MRKSYTAEQVLIACLYAGNVYSGRTSADEAIQHMVNSAGINETSAKDYITIYKHLVNGKTFLRGMGSEAMEIFLSNIRESHGAAGITSALASLQLHIERTERANNSTMHSMRVIFDKLKIYADEPENLDEIERNFKSSVERSINSSGQDRARRLATADASPKIAFAITKIFRRNPDVVAEVLIRANGSCERCHMPAPFLRAKDGTPYLEVHHRKKLADGGLDTVKNAIALCPNCHREAHYGSSGLGLAGG